MSEIPPETLKSVDAKLKARYTSRYREFDRDPRTLGWDTKANQTKRFEVATSVIAATNRSVLDIGCGLADFLDYAIDRGQRPAKYTGIDINPEFVDANRSRFDQYDFECRNILYEPMNGPVAEVGYMFGVLNFRFDEIENGVFARDMIAAAFELTSDTLAVDMLSDCRDEAYPFEDHVHYYNPAEMLEFCLSLTPHVLLRHDYASIPQREFMLFLSKGPRLETK